MVFIISFFCSKVEDIWEQELEKVFFCLGSEFVEKY